jgi:hypothetical protein
MSKTAPEAKAEPTEEVVLDADHEHAGKPYKKGDTLTVSKRVADWLRANGVVGQAPATEKA